MGDKQHKNASNKGHPQTVPSKKSYRREIKLSPFSFVIGAGLLFAGGYLAGYFEGRTDSEVNTACDDVAAVSEERSAVDSVDALTASIVEQDTGATPGVDIPVATIDEGVAAADISEDTFDAYGAQRQLLYAIATEALPGLFSDYLDKVTYPINLEIPAGSDKVLEPLVEQLEKGFVAYLATRDEVNGLNLGELPTQESCKHFLTAYLTGFGFKIDFYQDNKGVILTSHGVQYSKQNSFPIEILKTEVNDDLRTRMDSLRRQ